jgi:hypothetical protein
VRPKSIIIACADANFYYSKLTWQSWTATGARATGRATENSCTPNCAAGKFHSYPGSVRLSHVVRCKSGRREFTHLAWQITNAPKTGIPAKGSTTFRCT